MPRYSLLASALLTASCASSPPPAPSPVAPVVDVPQGDPAPPPPAEPPTAEPPTPPPPKDAPVEEPTEADEIASALAELDVTALGALSGSSSGGFGGLGTTGPGSIGGLIGTNPGGKPPQGALTKDEIQKEMRRHAPKYKACYMAQLQKDPNLSGKVQLKFSIAPDGSVKPAEIKKGIHPDVDACIKAVALRMQFPKPRGGGPVVVSYPFVFAVTP